MIDLGALTPVALTLISSKNLNVELERYVIIAVNLTNFFRIFIAPKKFAVFVAFLLVSGSE